MDPSGKHGARVVAVDDVNTEAASSVKDPKFSTRIAFRLEVKFRILASTNSLTPGPGMRKIPRITTQDTGGVSFQAKILV